MKFRPLICAVGEQFLEKGEHAEQRRHEREAAVAILNVGGGDDAVQEQALGIGQNMALLALDQFPRIEAVRVDACPPFSRFASPSGAALLTLWLSMMQAVGFASRSAFSRHST